MDNRGAEKLRAALTERGAGAELARKLSVGPDKISRWASGDHAPNTEYRARIEDELGIPWRSWDEEIEGAA